jgi:hypothetical protein
MVSNRRVKSQARLTKSRHESTTFMGLSDQASQEVPFNKLLQWVQVEEGQMFDGAEDAMPLTLRVS